MKKFVIFSLFLGALLNFANGQTPFNFCNKPAVYKDNGGTRKTYFFNKGKVKREAFFLEACRIINDLTISIQRKESGLLGNIEKNSSIDSVILKSLIASNKELDALTKQANSINVKNTQDYDKLLDLLKKLRDLKCKRIDALTQFVNKKTNKLYSDVAFSVGSSDISRNGITEISKLVDNIIREISEWKNYVSSCNERVFENDLFILVVDISGYADQQGADALNLTLSENRAKSVKLEIIKQLNSIVKNQRVSLIFDKIQTRGYGEELPPGATQSGQDDPSRRVCIISSLVGPSSLLK
jgi:outer membrane protein OmpA-like peptidoglycan-associated protein